MCTVYFYPVPLILCASPETDKKFLAFFFRRLKQNTTGRYTHDFPYVSPCGPETNYVHCDDLPVVYTHLLTADKQIVQNIHTLGATTSSRGADTSLLLSYGGAGDRLTVPFQPDQLHMCTESGRVYHTGPEVLGGVGLVKSSLAIELSGFFQYGDGSSENSQPVGFEWRGHHYQLRDTVTNALRKLR